MKAITKLEANAIYSIDVLYAERRHDKRVQDSEGKLESDIDKAVLKRKKTKIK